MAINRNVIDKIKRNGIILSGYIRYKSPNKTCYLALNSRILAKYLQNKPKKRVVIIREKDEREFILYVNRKGNFLTPRVKESYSCIPSNNLLLNNEKEFLHSEKSKFSFPIKIKILPSQFGLKKYDLYPDQNTARLAYALERLNIVIPQRIMTSHTSPYDLFFWYKGLKILVEITKVKPSERAEVLNFRHQPLGGSIRTHIFDVYRACVLDKLRKENRQVGFVIISNLWKEYNHIKELLLDSEEIKCNIIFMDFSNKKWPQICAKELLNKLKEK